MVYKFLNERLNENINSITSQKLKEVVSKIENQKIKGVDTKSLIDNMLSTKYVDASKIKDTDINTIPSSEYQGLKDYGIFDVGKDKMIYKDFINIGYYLNYMNVLSKLYKEFATLQTDYVRLFGKKENVDINKISKDLKISDNLINKYEDDPKRVSFLYNYKSKIEEITKNLNLLISIDGKKTRDFIKSFSKIGANILDNNTIELRYKLRYDKHNSYIIAFYKQDKLIGLYSNITSPEENYFKGKKDNAASLLQSGKSDYIDFIDITKHSITKVLFKDKVFETQGDFMESIEYYMNYIQETYFSDVENLLNNGYYNDYIQIISDFNAINLAMTECNIFRNFHKKVCEYLEKGDFDNMILYIAKNDYIIANTNNLSNKVIDLYNNIMFNLKRRDL